MNETDVDNGARFGVVVVCIARFGAAIGLVVLIAALLAWANIAKVNRQAIGAHNLSSLVDSGLSAAEEKALRQGLANELSNAPINQHLLSQYAILLRETDASSRKIDQAYQLLARLGWRSTPAQQNLIAYALAKEDFPAIIRRSDGLLRRGRFSAQISILLLTAEQSLEARRLLIDALQQGPSWSDAFFARAGSLNTKEGLAAHAALLNEFLDAGNQLGRAQTVGAMRAMIKHDLVTDAYGIFERLSSLHQNKTQGIFDPDFRIAADGRLRTEPAYPFEWNVVSGRGIYSRVEDRGSSGRLNLKWNGRGHPLLLSQLFWRGDKPVRGIRVKGLGNEGRLLSSMQLFISCVDEPSRKVQLYPTPHTEGGITYRNEVPDSCEFMRLEVYGLSENGSKPVDIQIDRIDLVD